jgi:hypothetical protein
MYHYRPLQDPQKFTQIGNFGLKIYHLATPAFSMIRGVMFTQVMSRLAVGRASMRGTLLWLTNDSGLQNHLLSGLLICSSG